MSDERVCRECAHPLDEAVPSGGTCPNCGAADAEHGDDTGVTPSAPAAHLPAAAMNPPLMTPRAPLAPGAFVRMGPYSPMPRPSSSPAQWAEDPSGRNQWRWWDGWRWTDHVANDGTATTDPL
jgi:Protein of unknown function (DUF2510)